MKLILIILFISVVIQSCSNTTSSDVQDRIEALEKGQLDLQNENPGLGTTMNQIQIYHTKFFYAMKNDNMELMQYIIHELDENFEEVVENHGIHDGINLADIAENTILPALDDLEQKVSSKDKDSISQSFDILTINCNNCHVTSNHPFIRIKYPEGNSYLNQDFRNLME